MIIVIGFVVAGGMFMTLVCFNKILLNGYQKESKSD